MGEPAVDDQRDEVAEALARVVAALPGGGEARPGQLEMARAVASAIANRRHLVVQAGTGTGKSLAYLVPAILSGSKVVVATATKALQDQLAGKDLPFLTEHLDTPFEFSVMKGRSNYLCRQRALEVAGGGDQLRLEDGAEHDGGPAPDPGRLGTQVKRLLQWAVTSETGDRAELDFEPMPQAWAQVSVPAMECPGATNCPAGEACFAEFARQRAEEADVVVVNTHLYGAHLASGGFVLPEHDVVVFDEAHELEDVAAASLGLELGAGRFRAHARTCRTLVDPTLAAAVDDLAERWEAALRPWFDTRLPDGLDEGLNSVLELAAQRVNAVNAAVRKSEGDPARKERATRAGGHLEGDIKFIVEGRPGYVSWVEGRPHSPVFRTAPVDVGGLLAEKLWGGVTAVMTSATIPLSLAARLGIDPDRYDELDAGSPFPYDEHGLLYCAAHLPDPRQPGYREAMHAELEALIRAAGGRTLALFTSWKAMQEAAEVIDATVPWRVLTQSDLPKPALVKAFTDDETSCLFATMGFWQGVDVPGRSCSLVTIDKLPFPRPDEPLMQARRERAGPAAFRLVDLPRAATLLAQGTGRLIRSATDRGVVAVLDSRLATAGYRWELVRALPPMRRTRHLDDVRTFLAAMLDEPSPSGPSGT